MKTYTIKNVDISESEIKELIKNNPELLKESKGGRYFFPEEGELFHYTSVDGSARYVSSYTPGGSDIRMVLNGVFKSESEAKEAVERQKAIVRIWKWQQENAPFELDWQDENQHKYYAYYGHRDKEIFVTYNCTAVHQNILPYFKSEEDTKRAIKELESDYKIYFGVK